VWEEFARYFCFCFILRAEGKGKKNDIEMFHEPKTNLMKHKKKKDFPPKWGFKFFPIQLAQSLGFSSSVFPSLKSI